MRHRSRQLHRADVENKILSRGGLAEDALTMASYSPRQGDVLGHDRNPLGMDSTQIGVLEQMDQVGLRRLL